MMRAKNVRFRRGMTLIEAMLASTLLAMSASAVLLPFSVGAQSEQEDARRTTALYFGRELMEEIISKPFDDPEGGGAVGPDSGESSRDAFDNIDDYHGYVDGEGQSLDMVGIEKQTYDNLATDGMSREVEVQYVYVTGQDTSEDPSFVSIQILVKYDVDTIVTLRRLVHNPL
ncbi:MAG: hypothetical protein GY794_11385 [bacterium]|nr:hypothetical protein [bacterium]